MSQDDQPVRVLVTGFGPFLDVSINPSFEIVKLLSEQHSPAGAGIEIIAHPVPLKAAYRSLLQTAPDLLRQHDNPDIVLHIGLATDRDYFAVEQSASRDGYHQYPDVERQTLRKDEGLAVWGKKSADKLETTLHLDAVVRSWKRNLSLPFGDGGTVDGDPGRPLLKKGKGRGGGQKRNDAAWAARGRALASGDVRLSDDVGDYVCGLLYYASMAAMQQLRDRVGRRYSGARNVVFLHVPPLEGEAALAKGLEVVVALIKALAESVT
ncbi:hypothetical protein Micbo1qcDRAFT_236639 [Microdochium bolleyi]|uniref:Peptidase C15, pyroglutamyl peptidase I-like protein n=1 Tax=Microdochium bolleyi TaxID=196109 RepID=A0A136IPT1_9PEZI|nr:hypothetical protein Micbo1qcDRAFT_236639 [Microdochium bolleyi]